MNPCKHSFPLPLQESTWGPPDSTSLPLWSLLDHFTPTGMRASAQGLFFSLISSGRWPVLPYPKENYFRANPVWSDFFFFFFFFHNLVGLQFLYVCGYRCQEEEAWGSHASPVAWKLLTLLRNNSLQSPGSKQAGQHILLMPGLQAEWSAHSSEVWWRNVSVPRVPSVVWTPGNLHLGIGEIPKLGETITPTRICVRCSVSSHSEWTSTRMFLWFFVFI